MGNTQSQFTRIWKWAQSLDFRNPLVIVGGILLVSLPFALGHIMKMGIALGLMQTTGILLLYKKLPKPVKDWCQRHPLIADISLDIAATASLAGVFNAGAILAISAVFSGLILTWAIPAMGKYDKEHTERATCSGDNP